MQEKKVGNMICRSQNNRRKIELANNTVGDELAEKTLLMQEEHANELRSIREQTDVTMRGAIRNNASMDAEHKEEEQSMRANILHNCFATRKRKTSRNRENQRQVASQRQ